MAKRNAVDITLPHGITLKADRLEARTIRTLKHGDYLLTSKDVRGRECHFFTMVTVVDGETVYSVFGSGDWAHDVSIPKGTKVDVYRPL